MSKIFCFFFLKIETLMGSDLINSEMKKSWLIASYSNYVDAVN